MCVSLMPSADSLSDTVCARDKASSLTMFLTHLLACPWGSMNRGQRWENWVMTPFSTERLSFGKPAIYTHNTIQLYKIHTCSTTSYAKSECESTDRLLIENQHGGRLGSRDYIILWHLGMLSDVIFYVVSKGQLMKGWSDLPWADLHWVPQGADQVGLFSVQNTQLFEAMQPLVCHGCPVLCLKTYRQHTPS